MSKTNQNTLEAIDAIQKKLGAEGTRIHIAITSSNGQTIVDGNDLSEVLGNDYDDLCRLIWARLKHRIILQKCLTVKNNLCATD